MSPMHVPLKADVIQDFRLWYFDPLAGLLSRASSFRPSHAKREQVNEGTREPWERDRHSSDESVRRASEMRPNSVIFPTLFMT